MGQDGRGGAEECSGEGRRGFHQVDADGAPLTHAVVSDLLKDRSGGSEVLRGRFPTAQGVTGDVETVSQPLGELVGLEDREHRVEGGLKLLGQGGRKLAQSLAGLFD